MFSKLRNLGPKSQEMLIRANIRDVDQLMKMGAVRVYVQVKRSEMNVSLNLLWALEGALSDRPWQEIAKEERLRLLLDVEALENMPTSADTGLKRNGKKSHFS